MTCGDLLKNSIYFLGDHKNGVKAHDCSKTKVATCTDQGGYDLEADPCYGTCKKDHD